MYLAAALDSADCSAASTDLSGEESSLNMLVGVWVVRLKLPD